MQARYLVGALLLTMGCAPGARQVAAPVLLKFEKMIIVPEPVLPIVSTALLGPDSMNAATLTESLGPSDGPSATASSPEAAQTCSK
jgi:hypothetical protein